MISEKKRFQLQIPDPAGGNRQITIEGYEWGDLEKASRFVLGNIGYKFAVKIFGRVFVLTSNETLQFKEHGLPFTLGLFNECNGFATFPCNENGPTENIHWVENAPQTDDLQQNLKRIYQDIEFLLTLYDNYYGSKMHEEKNTDQLAWMRALLEHLIAGYSFLDCDSASQVREMLIEIPRDDDLPEAVPPAPEVGAPFLDRFFAVERRTATFVLGGNSDTIFYNMTVLDLNGSDCRRLLEAADIDNHNGDWYIGVFNVPMPVCGVLFPKHTLAVFQGKRPGCRFTLFSTVPNDKTLFE